MDRPDESLVMYRAPCTEECLDWRRLGCHIVGRIEVALKGQSLSIRHILTIICSSSQLLIFYSYTSARTNLLIVLIVGVDSFYKLHIA